MSRSEDLPRLLTDVASRDPATASRLLEAVYEPLRELAGRHLRRQPGHTLQPTALVHEVYLNVLGKAPVEWESRAHFFAFCATVMRGVLVDHARGRDAAKRGGRMRRVTLSATLAAEAAVDTLELDEALKELAALSERQARIVEGRVFAGMTNTELAHTLGVSTRTVDNDWAMARAWLSLRLSEAN